MKKIITLILILVLLFSLCACDNNEATPDSSVQETTTSLKTDRPVENDNGLTNEWTNENSVSVGTSDMQFGNFYIFTPDNICADRGTNKIASQNDNTIIAFGGQNFMDEYSIENVDSVFPSYFEKVSFVLNDYFDSSLDSACEFNIEKKEPMTVNGYEMCRYSGSVKYFDSDKEVSSNYVAYSVKLKNIDCYAYWYVMDLSEDLSAGEAVNYNADYIAEHIHE